MLHFSIEAGQLFKTDLCRSGQWYLPHTQQTFNMEQFIADITKEFSLTPEAVDVYTKMFERMMVSGKQMYDTEEEATAFAVRVVRTAFEDEEESDDEEYECYCQECGEVIEGMTEEEFEEDDELKLCAKCEEECKVE